MVRNTDALVFSRARSLKVTGDTDSDLEWELVAERPSKRVVGAVDKISHPVSSEVRRNGCRSSFIGVSSSNVKDFVLNVHFSHTQELQVETRICCLVASRTERSKLIRC